MPRVIFFSLVQPADSPLPPPQAMIPAFQVELHISETIQDIQDFECALVFGCKDAIPQTAILKSDFRKLHELLCHLRSVADNTNARFSSLPLEHKREIWDYAFGLSHTNGEQA